MALRRRRKA